MPSITGKKRELIRLLPSGPLEIQGRTDMSLKHEERISFLKKSADDAISLRRMLIEDHLKSISDLAARMAAVIGGGRKRRQRRRQFTFSHRAGSKIDFGAKPDRIAGDFARSRFGSNDCFSQ